MLDNVVWHALTGPQAHCAAGRGRARRFAPGFSRILGFADPAAPDFSELDGCSEAGEQFYCLHWAGPVPAGWRLESEGLLRQMVRREADPPPYDGLGLESLGAAQVERAMALAELTHPGPFGPRTIELGDYFGVFDGPRLLAMAGERMQAGRYREISGVCTHPQARGLGLARRLVSHLVARQRLRGQVSFLHVMDGNESAIRLYESLGFETRQAGAVRVLTRL